MIGGVPIDPAKTYTVTITDFMYSGGDGYTMFHRQAIDENRAAPPGAPGGHDPEAGKD